MLTNYKKKIKIFLSRFLLVYTFHLIIKWGDHTFNHFFDFTWRGILFSVYIIFLWMFALYLLDYLKLKLFSVEKSKLVYFGFHILYGYFFALLTNLGYRYVDTRLFNNDWKDIGYFNPSLVFGLLCIYLATLGFYEYFQIDLNSKDNLLARERLKKENAVANYKLLKTQIQPHFLFNSLGVLSSLVNRDTHLASDFITKLSKMLRYMTEQGDQMYVTLEEEVEFTNNYLFLMKNRFDQSIIFINRIDRRFYEECIVPPSSLQTLVENAIKHNILSSTTPLIIEFSNDSQLIYVKNPLNLKRVREPATGIGLTNLSKRFELLIGTTIEVNVSDNHFCVSFPIISKDQLHESTYFRG